MWLYGFFASESDKEIRKSEVTQVIVDDETELIFPPCKEVDFFFVAVVILKNGPLLAAFSCLLCWDQY